MATYTELLEKDFARQIEFLNIERYHELGYKGKGITILNAEGAGDHREMTSKVIRDYAPEVTLLESNISARTSGDKVVYCNVNINGEILSLEEAIDKYNIKIITKSYSGSTSTALLNYFKDLQKRKGVIFFNSAGNEGYDNGMWAKNDTAIVVSASTLKENGNIEISYYGSKGEVDFTCFMAKGRGTSASGPALASETVLLLNRYGDFTQVECVEILKSLCVSLGDKTKFGWGLPILPLTDKLEILEKMRGAEEMPDKPETPITTRFADVNETDWFYEDVNFCVENGLMQGDGDDTFEPQKPVTRAEEAATTRRIYEKIMQKIEDKI
jgi:hypothetical protein